MYVQFYNLFEAVSFCMPTLAHISLSCNLFRSIGHCPCSRRWKSHQEVLHPPGQKRSRSSKLHFQPVRAASLMDIFLPPPPFHSSSRIGSARQDKSGVPVSARTNPNPDSARSMASSRVPESGRSQAEVPSSSRSNVPNSSRTNTLETGRTYMDTARVHTALAALGAEKQALLSKLQQIDAALETGERKKASLPRPKK